MDCFNKEAVDVEHIGAMLPRLIMFPETSNILLEKTEAASAAFKMTWEWPERIVKEKNVADSGDPFAKYDLSFMEIGSNEDEDEYTDPNNGCTLEELTLFHKKIVKCLPVTLGFYPGNGNKTICWCPCSKAIKGWRDQFKVEGPREQCTKGKMTTEQLIQHLESKRGCIYHRFMTNYLELYFCKNKGTYLGLENVGHYSFYGKSDPKRQRSFDNENEFLIFKAKDDTRKQKLRNEKEAKEAA